MRAFCRTIQGARVQQRASNQGVLLAGKEADEDGNAPLEGNLTLRILTRYGHTTPFMGHAF